MTLQNAIPIEKTGFKTTEQNTVCGVITYEKRPPQFGFPHTVCLYGTYTSDRSTERSERLDRSERYGHILDLTM